MGIKKQIIESLVKISSDLGEETEIELTRPDLKNGDYTSNLALILASKLGQSPQALASEIAEKLKSTLGEGYKVEVAGPGFVNIWLPDIELIKNLGQERVGAMLKDKRLLVEYAHPNTHKEMHIGHLRTLITGEAMSRLFEANGAKVFRANYQGDIGPHVAKALFGVERLLKEENLSLEEVGTRTIIERAEFLGRAYAKGAVDYILKYQIEPQDLDTKIKELTKESPSATGEGQPL